MRFEPGDPGKGVDREALGPQLDHLVEGGAKALGALVGQAIHQVEVDGAKAHLARRRQQLTDIIFSLNALNGLLHQGVEVLDAEGESIEALGFERVEVGLGGDPGVELDGELRPWLELKAGLEASDELVELGGAVKGGRAAPQVELGDLGAIAQGLGGELGLTEDGLEVALSEAPLRADDGVAGAIEAALGAEGQVQIEGNISALAALGEGVEGLEVGLGAQVFSELQRGGIGGITRPRFVVAGQELRG